MLIKILREYLFKYKKWLILVLVFQTIQSIATLTLPTLNADIIDNIVSKGPNSYIWEVGAVMLGVTFIQVTFAIAATFYGARSAMGFGRDVRRDLFHTVMGYSAREVGQFGAPSLITRITNDVTQVQVFALMSLTLFVTAPIMIIGGLFFAIREDGPLSLILVVAIPVLLLTVGQVALRMHPQFTKMQNRIDRVNQVLREQISGMRVVRAFVREPDEAARFGTANADLTETSLKTGRMMAIMFPAVLLTINLSSVAAVWFGADRINTGQMQVGSLVAFLSYLIQILMAVMMGTWVFMMGPRASVCAGRIEEVLQTSTSVVAPTEGIAQLPGAASLEVRHAEFAFPGAEQPVLRDINFRVEAGETLAIIGSTGSGKTALLNVIARLFDVTAGEVLIGGVDVRELDKPLLERLIGFVPQKPFLFSGTIASNVRFGNQDATDQEVWDALDVAQARDFVTAKPEQLDSPITQGGTNVSGGQRQRLAIARALAHKPAIFLFDDSFSALDLATDARLRAALEPVTARCGHRDRRPARVHHRAGRPDPRARGGSHRRPRHAPRPARVVPHVPGDRRVAVRGRRGRRMTTNGAGGNGSTGNGAAGNGAGPGDNGRKKKTEDEIPVAGQRVAVNAGTRFGVGMPVEKSENFKSTVRRLLHRLAPERMRIAAVLLFAVVSVTLTVIGPRILGHATNIVIDGIQSPKGIDFGELHMVLLQVALIYLVAGLLSYTMSFILAGTVQRSMSKLRSDVEDKLNRLPLAYVDSQPRGDLLSRVTNDIDNVAQSLQQTLSMMLTSTLTIIGVVIMMISISPLLAIITLITVPISLVVMKLITARSKKKFIAQWRYTGTLNAQVEEAFTGHTLVRVFGQQDEVQRTFDEQNEELYQSSFGAQFISGTIQPAMMFLGNLNFLCIAVIGGLRVSAGQLSIGDIQAFIQYSRQFTQPLTQLASMANVLQSGIASLERVFELLDVEEQSPDPSRAAHRRRAPRSHRVLRRVLLVRPEPAAHQGPLARRRARATPSPSSAPPAPGKTTLVNLVMRFYELDDGVISLDGMNVAEMRRHDLRANVGMVLQDTWLFEGTIRENIAFGNPEATDEEIVAAAKATHVDHFVRSLPDGYDTVVDDEGTSVSAGEKQLLTIARAFLANPTILILDEATSSVDTRTEVLIQKAMAALRTNRTSFVIAHRLSTIRDADTILVMENGAIVEQGNHRELLERDGAYARLYNSQFAGAAIEVE